MAFYTHPPIQEHTFLDLAILRKAITVDVQKPNVRFGEPNQIRFGYRTFGFQTSENRTIQQPNYFPKCRNPNIWIADVYWILAFKPTPVHFLGQF